MLGTAKEEITKSDELWGNSDFKALREQQEKAFGYFGPYQFQMDKKEGAWEDVTTNSPRILANKILGLLATSTRHLFIDVDDETRAKREQIGKSEQLANGTIWAVDRALTRVPSGKSTQSALSFFSCVKGGRAQSFLWIENEQGLAVPKARVYDPEFCQWEEGDGELLKFCHRNYVSKAFIKKAYPEVTEEQIAGSAGTGGRVLTYTFWDEKSWKVAIKGSDDYIDSDDHNLGYIPVDVGSCGAVPYVQSDGTFENTMKWSWVNVFNNDWSLIDLQSKLLSISSSKATLSGKVITAGDYDSTKGDPPEDLVKLGYGDAKGRNVHLLFDTSKGQKFGGMIQPPSNEIIERFYNEITRMLTLSNLDPIAFGQMARSGSGVLAAELRSAALEFVNPFRKCVEDGYIWLAEEIVRQFKKGNFPKVNVEGIDAKRQKFYVEGIKPKDVEEKHFDCHLVPDRLRDESLELGLAIQKVKTGLTSVRTARLQHNIVQDSDREQDIIDEEFASKDPIFIFDKLAKKLKDKGEERYALLFLALAKIEIEKTVARAGMADMLPPEKGEEKPLTVSPQMAGMPHEAEMMEE